MVSHGKTKGQSYLLKPEMIRKLNFKDPTTLKAIEPHRLIEEGMVIHEGVKKHTRYRLRDGIL